MSLHEFALLNSCQRGFPLVERPYQRLAAGFGLTEAELLSCLDRLIADGSISRVGAVFAPGRIGASTLAALAVPEHDLDRVGEIVSSYREVNHNYEREHDYNLWFVAAAEDDARLATVLRSIAARTRCPLITAPLEEEFRIDLGFDLGGGAMQTHVMKSYLAEPLRLTDEERAIVASLQDGLPRIGRPFAVIAGAARTTEARVLTILQRWVQDGTIRRFGLIVRHRELGFVANAMSVWNVPDAAATELGNRLAREQGVTLAYRRRRCLPDWPYNLYCMVHGRERGAVERRIAEIGTLAGLDGCAHAVLFSRRRFKQTGARPIASRAVAHG